jgi:hypothetical protein
MPEGEPSALDYLRWLSTEISGLSGMFGGVNENFVTAAVEGALVMAGDSVDLDALQSTATESGADVIPTKHHVWRATWVVSKNGGAPSALTICWLLFVLHTKRCSFVCDLFCFDLVILILLLLFLGFAERNGNNQGRRSKLFLKIVPK